MPIAECINRHKYNQSKYVDTCSVCGVVKSKLDGKTPEELVARNN